MESKVLKWTTCCWKVSLNSYCVIFEWNTGELRHVYPCIKLRTCPQVCSCMGAPQLRRVQEHPPPWSELLA